MKNLATISSEVNALCQHTAQTTLLLLQIEKRGLQAGDMLTLKNEIEQIKRHFNDLAQLWRKDG